MSQVEGTYSAGVERALLKAARDDAFHEDLQERRGAAAEEAGIALTPNERAVLEAIPPAQLDAAVASLKDRDIHEPTAPQHIEAPAGIRPDVVRGSRSTLAVVAVGGIAAVTAAGIYGATITTGHMADLPPVPSSTDAGSDGDQAAQTEPSDAGDPDAD